MNNDDKNNTASKKERVHVVWFKTTDLRVHDHEPFLRAHELAGHENDRVLHVLILDPALGYGSAAPLSRVAKLPRLGIHRAQFLWESIVDLQVSLEKEGHKLFVYMGPTAEILQDVCETFRVVAVHAQGPEFCTEERAIEATVKHIVSHDRLKLYCGFPLHHQDDLPVKFQQGAPRYKPFLQAVQKGKRSAFARQPLSIPIKWARPPKETNELSSQSFSHPVPTSWKDLVHPSLLNVAENNPGSPYEHFNDEEQQCTDNNSLTLSKGGETAALQAMTKFIWYDDRLRNYVGSSDSMTPGKYNALNSTTHLSPYLAHGCLSPRTLYWEVQRYERKRTRNRSTYWVFHELVFRDYFLYCSRGWKSSMFSINGPLGSHGHPWRKPSPYATQLFQLWQDGQTGYPLVDAGMRQLRQEGCMPHLIRQLAAGFLVRDLRLDWRWGAEWFEQHLVDYTPDANWGNWGYRILPIPQIMPLADDHLTNLEILSWPVVHDPHLRYILKWIPELRQVAVAHPDNPVAVREPWRLGDNYQRLEALDVTPRKDSPLWIMSVNRVNWPDYQQMMTGTAWTLPWDEADIGQVVDATKCSYARPIVRPLELEILMHKIPIDHTWGDASNASNTSNRPKPGERPRRGNKNRKKNGNKNGRRPSKVTNNKRNEG